MNNRLLLGATATLLLTGCFPAYKIAPDMLGTTLEFEGTQNFTTWFFDRPPRCGKAVILKSPYVPFQKGSQPLPLRPNERFTFGIMGIVSTGYNEHRACNATVTFVPTAGASYRARYVYTEGLKLCGIEIVKLVKVADKIQEVAEPSARDVGKDEKPESFCTI